MLTYRTNINNKISLIAEACVSYVYLQYITIEFINKTYY